MERNTTVMSGEAQSANTLLDEAMATPTNTDQPIEHMESLYSVTDVLNKGACMKEMNVVLPGDRIPQLDPEAHKDTVFIGPGLRCQEGVVYATRSGHLRIANKKLYYIDSHQKRYIPQQGEYVIGIITKKKGDNYLINIAANEYATLSDLLFENNARKARTNLRPGDLIFGKLLVASKDKEPELVSIDIVNNTVGISSLPESGILFHVPLHVARLIANPGNTMLKIIAKKIEYTIVVGYNGRVWLKSQNLNNVVIIMNFVMMLEVFTLDEAEKNVQLALGSSR
ncbi:hypothetical protein Pcinc_033177 [Petrolisthes cinctipes]|uniref:K Homology domain-containing protein n=1 Tax=Petrolisthes cinctipes TaxID=88211 RepID=A0AAE1ESX5_PETCI|nr:hypothetical protein Pcinc_033177 [Petrolisthes cinctipes]